MHAACAQMMISVVLIACLTTTATAEGMTTGKPKWQDSWARNLQRSALPSAAASPHQMQVGGAVVSQGGPWYRQSQEDLRIAAETQGCRPRGCGGHLRSSSSSGRRTRQRRGAQAERSSTGQALTMARGCCRLSGAAGAWLMVAAGVRSK